MRDVIELAQHSTGQVVLSRYVAIPKDRHQHIIVTLNNFGMDPKLGVTPKMTPNLAELVEVMTESQARQDGALDRAEVSGGEDHWGSPSGHCEGSAAVTHKARHQRKEQAFQGFPVCLESLAPSHEKKPLLETPKIVAQILGKVIGQGASYVAPAFLIAGLICDLAR